MGDAGDVDEDPAGEARGLLHMHEADQSVWRAGASTECEASAPLLDLHTSVQQDAELQQDPRSDDIQASVGDPLHVDDHGTQETDLRAVPPPPYEPVWTASTATMGGTPVAAPSTMAAAWAPPAAQPLHDRFAHNGVADSASGAGASLPPLYSTAPHVVIDAGESGAGMPSAATVARPESDEYTVPAEGEEVPLCPVTLADAPTEERSADPAAPPAKRLPTNNWFLGLIISAMISSILTGVLASRKSAAVLPSSPTPTSTVVPNVSVTASASGFYILGGSYVTSTTARNQSLANTVPYYFDALHMNTTAMTPISNTSSTNTLAVITYGVAFQVGAYIVYAGGLDATGSATAMVKAFDPRTRTWSVLQGGLNVPRSAPGGVALSNTSFLVCGGQLRDSQNAYQPLSSCERCVVDASYTTMTCAFSLSLPSPRAYFSMVSSEDTVYAIGGSTSSSGSGGYLADLLALNLAVPSAQWTTLPAMHSPRSGLGAAVLHGYIYVCGGASTNATYPAATERYSLQGGMWAVLATLPAPDGAGMTAGVALAAPAPAFYCIGGGPDASFMDRYDVLAGTWTQIADYSTLQGHFPPAAVAYRWQQQ